MGIPACTAVEQLALLGGAGPHQDRAGDPTQPVPAVISSHRASDAYQDGRDVAGRRLHDLDQRRLLVVLRAVEGDDLHNVIARCGEGDQVVLVGRQVGADLDWLTVAVV